MNGKADRCARWLLSLAAASWLAGCATTPEEDPVLQGRLSDLDTRTSSIERVVQNQSLLTLAQRADQQQNELSVLRGRIEVLENANETLRKQQRDLYADLDKRIAALSAPAAAAPAVADQPAYNQSFEALKAGKYPDAISGFQQFLQTFPQSSLADNAQYWLGEAYYVTRDFQNAGTAFQAVLDRWPDSRKAPDALLKLGYTQAELHHNAQARVTLAAVSARYPGSDAANLAAARLLALPAQ
jgi:tol-pal system protein YbgF